MKLADLPARRKAIVGKHECDSPDRGDCWAAWPSFLFNSPNFVLLK